MFNRDKFSFHLYAGDKKVALISEDTEERARQVYIDNDGKAEVTRVESVPWGFPERLFRIFD